MNLRVFLLLLLACQTVCFSQKAAAKKKINVVFILADDLGWTDLGCYGSTFYETPNLDALAKDGMRFTRAYAACPVCSPTRSSLLTGKYPVRTGITDFIGAAQPATWARNTPLLPANYVTQLDLKEFTLPEAMQAAGYKTYFAGKWHLGPETHWPEKQGFDSNMGGYGAGQPKSYFAPYSNPRLPDGPENEYLPERLADETAAFIRQHKNQPFFVYHSLYLAHTPLRAKPGSIAKYEQKRKELGLTDKFGKEGASDIRLNQAFPVYAAMIESLDEVVGKIVSTLKAEGLYENTLIVFTSDNGGLSTSEGRPTSNLPLRAGKGWMYEGGIREPLIMRLPGVTKAGSVTDVMVSSPDFYPTILAVTGQPLLSEQHLDGHNFAPVLAGKSQPERTLYWHYPHYGNQGGRPASAIMQGDWKLIKWYGIAEPAYELFQVKQDPGEQQELSHAHPKQLAAMKAKLEAFLKSTLAQYPTPNSKFTE